jgi:hypothetical protein
MKMLLTCVAVLILLAKPVLAEQPVKREVRDSSGTLILMLTTRGNQTDVKSPSGKLLFKFEISSEGKTETKSQPGNPMYKAK